MTGEDRRGSRDEPTPSLEEQLDAIDDLFYVVGPDERLRRWNDRLPAVTGHADDELAGLRPADLLVPAERDRAAAHAAEVRETGGGEFRGHLLARDGERLPFEFRDRRLTDGGGEPAGRCGIGRDVGKRDTREVALRREKAFTDAILDAIPDLLYVFDEDGRFLRWNDEVEAVTGYTGEEIAGMHPLEFVAPADRDRAADAIAAVVEDGTTEVVEADLVTKDGTHVPHEFTGSRIVDACGDRHGLVGTGRDVSERKRRRRDLERQRDELQRLHRINALIRDVNRALVEADSRPAVERALCERLTADDGYAFAWVGEPDLADDRLVPRMAAGDGDGYLDEVTVSFDGEDPSGPAARAVRTERTQVARPVEAPASSSWSEAAARRGFGSGAAIPVTYGGTLYAVLSVYSRRADAFDDQERTILTELVETVGYVLNAILHRDVLVNDTSVELEFRVDDGPTRLLDATRDGSGRLLFDRTVRAGENRVLWFVTAVGMDAERIASFEDDDVVDGVSLLSSDGRRHRVQIVSEEPPLTGALGAHGGGIRWMSIEDGEITVLAELPTGADLRAVKRSVREAIPDARLVAQRTATRDPESLRVNRSRATEPLTERQRAVLEAAYEAGYYERPRRTTGDELAESMGITRSTFHQHLKVATRKLLGEVLDDRPVQPD